jgi:hypothetical protein
VACFYFAGVKLHYKIKKGALWQTVCAETQKEGGRLDACPLLFYLYSFLLDYLLAVICESACKCLCYAVFYLTATC